MLQCMEVTLNYLFMKYLEHKQQLNSFEEEVFSSIR